jgi:hypothetical protein
MLCRTRERSRTSWAGSEAGSSRAVSPRATQCAIEPVAGGRERAAHHCPARQASRAAGREINAHPTGKSQSHVAESPARVANVIPQRQTGRESSRPIGEPVEIAAPSFALRAARPSSQRAQCSETASLNNRHRVRLQRQQTSWPSVSHGSDSRAAVTVAQGTCISHQHKTCLCMPYCNLLRVPPVPKCCPAVCPERCEGQMRRLALLLCLAPVIELRCCHLASIGSAAVSSASQKHTTSARCYAA